MITTRNILLFVLSSFFALALCGATSIAVAYFVIAPKLPDIEVLRDVRFQVPLRVYSREGKLIAEYGEKRRVPLDYSAIPPLMVKAFLAAEDDRFFTHPGVDYQGLLRAVWVLVRTGEKGQGGSTITMQLARNFFLTSEKTYIRKFKEILLSFKIEEQLSKEEILELYLNKIYLGHRSYGVGAAAQVYYGASAPDLTLAQVAMIAGLPKAPSRFNPITNPKRATIRRNYVLRRMVELSYISKADFDSAMATEDDAQWHGGAVEISAPYVAEMVRNELFESFGEAIYSDGTKVYTTIDAGLQGAANAAVRTALINYDRRHGYRGANDYIDLSSLKGVTPADLIDYAKPVSGIKAAVVVAVHSGSIDAVNQDDVAISIPFESMLWAKPALANGRVGKEPASPADIVSPGDVVRYEEDEAGLASFSQVPSVQGALVSADPSTGEIWALVGGFDYNTSKFNRAVQAQRQMGSVFKPFLYSAALEHGYTLSTLINDTAVVFDDTQLEGTWRPENYSRKFYGPTRFREALVKSRNLVSVKILQDIGIRNTIEHVKNFGFTDSQLPRDLSLSLGSAAVPPLEVAAAYSVFANGGRRTRPYLIDVVELPSGDVINWHDASAGINPDSDDFGDELPAVSEQNVYLMDSVLREVVQRGTAIRAKALNRDDIAGKTGTTNDQRDAWFAGFNRNIVTICWVGFDDMTPLGTRETGSRAALPMWIDFMRAGLDSVPYTEYKMPPGIVQVKIDKVTGQRATAQSTDTMFELFRADNAPALEVQSQGAEPEFQAPPSDMDLF